MNYSKILKGAIGGGVAFFLLGWLVYGMLLADYMDTNMPMCNERGDENMIMWAMIGANLIYGLFLAVVFDRAGISSAMDGLKFGGLIMLIMAISMALFQHSMTTMYADTMAMLVDVLVSTVMGAVIGAITAWAMNMGAKA